MGRSLQIAAVFAALWGCVPFHSAAQEIGAVEEVRAEAFGTPPAENRSRLAAARRLVANEAIETGREAAVGLRFTDQTVFRIGPDALVTLDRFAFDPNRTGNALALQLGRGAFRFISGQMPKEGIALRTPTVVIGVRGTDFLTEVAPGGQTAVTVFEGEVLVQPIAGLPATAVLVGAGQRAEASDGTSAPTLGTAGNGDDGAGFLGSRRLNDTIDPAAPPPLAPQPTIVTPPVIVPPIPAPTPVPQKFSFCFTGDMLVTVPGGVERIDSIAVGAWVLRVDEEGGLQPGRVLGVERHEPSGAEAVIHGLWIGDRRLDVTGNHPLLTTTGWRRAADLKPGDGLISANGGRRELVRIERRALTVPVYHLRLEQDAAYLVNGIVVGGR